MAHLAARPGRSQPWRLSVKRPLLKIAIRHFPSCPKTVGYINLSMRSPLGRSRQKPQPGKELSRHVTPTTSPDRAHRPALVSRTDDPLARPVSGSASIRHAGAPVSPTVGQGAGRPGVLWRVCDVARQARCAGVEPAGVARGRSANTRDGGRACTADEAGACAPGERRCARDGRGPGCASRHALSDMRAVRTCCRIVRFRRQYRRVICGYKRRGQSGAAQAGRGCVGPRLEICPAWRFACRKEPGPGARRGARDR